MDLSLGLCVLWGFLSVPLGFPIVDEDGFNVANFIVVGIGGVLITLAV